MQCDTAKNNTFLPLKRVLFHYVFCLHANMCNTWCLLPQEVRRGHLTPRDAQLHKLPRGQGGVGVELRRGWSLQGAGESCVHHCHGRTLLTGLFHMSCSVCFLL